MLLPMQGAIEAAGDVLAGAAWARAVEPPAGEADHAIAGGDCLNCGTALVGRYCHSCGQSSHVHRTLVSIGHDLLHGVFHFEGKIWRTVPMLVLHPGALTRRYIAGERARFVSPLALFLFTVFLMFAAYSWVGPGDLSEHLSSKWGGTGEQVARARASARAALADVQRQRALAAASGLSTADLDHRVDQARTDVDSLQQVTDRFHTAGGQTVTVRSKSGWFSAAYRRAKENPGLLLYKLQSGAYKYSWVLIFLSTPLVALLFLWRRRFGLYDHATFVTYSISFMSLLVLALELLTVAGVPAGVTGTLFVFAPPVHMFAQLRGAYGLSVLSAAWRTLFLVVFASVTLLSFLLGLLVLEVAH